MKTIKMELDFLIGPIVKDVYGVSKKKLLTGIDVIDNDVELSELNEKASMLYSSFYVFDKENACNFDNMIAKEHIKELKDLIAKIKERMNELNDGSFEINDLVTDQLDKL